MLAVEETSALCAQQRSAERVRAPTEYGFQPAPLRRSQLADAVGESLEGLEGTGNNASIVAE